MARPPCCRRVEGRPLVSAFGPSGALPEGRGEIAMTMDEFEAIRLADHEGLYHEQAAARMQVSRPTFGRILQSAHEKVAEALVAARTIRIAGGPVHAALDGPARCPRCAREWRGRPGCPRDGHDEGSSVEPEAEDGACRGRRRRRRCGPDGKDRER